MEMKLYSLFDEQRTVFISCAIKLFLLSVYILLIVI